MSMGLWTYRFDYAIRFPNGTYYTGRVNSPAEPNAWQGAAHEAYTYTPEGAARKLQQPAFAGKGCTVERLNR